MRPHRTVVAEATQLQPGQLTAVQPRGVRLMPERLVVLAVDGPEVRFGSDELLPYVPPGTQVTICAPEIRHRIKGVSVYGGLSILVVLCEPIW